MTIRPMTIRPEMVAPTKPMMIYTAWFQGRDKAPDFVRRVFDLWEAFNPECRLHVVEQAEADAILAEHGISQPRITAQITSDLVRKVLLARTGGVWVDATLLPTRPLAEWLTPELKQAGFFAFRSPGDPNLTLQTWFLYAAPDHPLITAWRDLFVDYLRTPRLYPTWRRALIERRLWAYWTYCRKWAARDTLWFVDPAGGRKSVFYPYAVTFYNFAWMVRSDPDLAAIWDRVPKRWADLPHLIGAMSRDRETPEAAFFQSAEEVLALLPVHKLNSRDGRFAALAAWVAQNRLSA